MSTGTAIALVALGAWLFVLILALSLAVTASRADEALERALRSRRQLRLVSRDEQAEKSASE